MSRSLRQLSVFYGAVREVSVLLLGGGCWKEILLSSLRMVPLSSPPDAVWMGCVHLLVLLWNMGFSHVPLMEDECQSCSTGAAVGC